MRTYTRVVFGLNALYQLLVRVLALLAPALLASAAYAVPDAMITDPLLAVFRGFGGLILTLAAVSGLVAWRPEQHPILYPVMGLSAVFTLLAWALALMAGQMTLGQAGLDLVVQTLILIGVLGYGLRVRVPAPGEAGA